MCQKQFSYSSNQSKLCGLLIYTVLKQYIMKNVGLHGVGPYPVFKIIRTMKQVKEEENTFIPSISILLPPKY